MPPKKPIATGRKVPVKTPVKVTGKGQTSKPGPKVAKKPSKEKVKKGPTKSDLAATVIQKYTRRFLAKKSLARLKAKRDEYDALIDKMQHQAYLDMVNAEREEQEQGLAKTFFHFFV